MAALGLRELPPCLEKASVVVEGVLKLSAAGRVVGSSAAGVVGAVWLRVGKRKLSMLRVLV